jgi:hypothetical protein
VHHAEQPRFWKLIRVIAENQPKRRVNGVEVRDVTAGPTPKKHGTTERDDTDEQHDPKKQPSIQGGY